MRVDFVLPLSARKVITHTWHQIATRINLPVDLDVLRIGTEDDAEVDLAISNRFLECLASRDYRHLQVFRSEPLIFCDNGLPDYLGTITYMMHSLQEYVSDAESYDNLGRFDSSASYQHKFDCFRDDLVLKLIRRMLSEVPRLRNSELLTTPTRVFLSHDMDMINGSIWQEGKAALKSGNIPLLLKVILKYVLTGPSYGDVDRIMDIHDVHSLKSTFFWLAQKGMIYHPKIDKSIPQADYDIQSNQLKDKILQTQSRGFNNGLHKSTASTSYDEELLCFDQELLLNRNHYLKFRLPTHLHDLERSKISVDCSLGFGPEFGFRNNYAWPVIPFDFENDRSHSFMFVPLNIMDTTFKFYKKLSPQQSSALILDFLERHKEGSLISILWHNDMFSSVKNPRWLKLYKDILYFCRQSGIQSVGEKELLDMREVLSTCHHNNS